MKKCRHCREPFTPVRPLQKACSFPCELALAGAIVGRIRDARAKAERKADKARREKMKPRAKWLAECQAIANRIARIRDKDLPCVSCDRPASWAGQWHGSHFRSVGAASAVRLNLWNIHKACSPCNVHLSGNLLNYRPRLIERIGLDRVEWLEAQNQVTRHDIDYLKRFKRVMGKRLARMEKSNG